MLTYTILTERPKDELNRDIIADEEDTFVIGTDKFRVVYVDTQYTDRYEILVEAYA